MTLITNYTDIKESILREVLSVVKPEGIPEIASFHIWTKEENRTHGLWGLFIPDVYRINLYVPHWRKGMKLEGKRTYTERDYLYQNNLDFLAAVIGHEYYHAWQFHNEQDIFPLYHAKLKSYFEVGAEIYETTALNKWKDHLQELGVYKAVATGG